MTSNILISLAKNSSGERRSQKIPVYLKLAPAVIEYFKTQGRGYQARINDLLVEYVTLAQTADTAESSATVLTGAPSVRDEKVRHAQRLFKKYYAQCFWHLRADLEVTEALLPLIAQGLKRFGGREGFMEAQTLCQ
jgi:hypothetical protein